MRLKPKKIPAAEWLPDVGLVARSAGADAHTTTPQQDEASSSLTRQVKF